MSTTIEDRAILLLRSQTAEGREKGRYGLWERLEAETGISSQRWSKTYSRRQRPTTDMLEAMARKWPSYAFWLATGITDAVNGHVAPETAQTFPERVFPASEETERYFKLQVQLADKLGVEAQLNLDDERERMLAFERTKPLSHWVSSEITGVAYKLANSEEYLQMQEARETREQERRILIERIEEAERIADQIGPATDNEKTTHRIGFDAISRHQSRWELLYRPKNRKTAKFALSFMNVPPENLTEEDIARLTKLRPMELYDYLDNQQLNPDTIISTGQVTTTPKELTEDEVEKFKRAIALRKALRG